MQTSYAFGAFELDPARRSLQRSGEPVAIGAKAFDALVCLVEHAGSVVTRNTLSSALWPTTIVEDNNLSQTIQALRRALGDAGSDYIVTVPRRGYQFVGDVVTTHAQPVPVRSRSRIQSVVLVAAGISLAINLMFFGALMLWNEPPGDATRANAAGPHKTPVKTAKWIAERDKRELSAT